MTTRCVRLVRYLSAVWGFSQVVAPVAAQCAEWLPGGGIPGVDGDVHASTMWDPDGAGPLPPRLVIGGSFTVAGDVLAANIAAYEPVARTWAPLGSGTNQRVDHLVALPNGDLIAAGVFQEAGGVPANRIARWDGVAWSPLGAGLDGGVGALAVLANGDVVAGGSFLTSGATVVQRIARWDGLAWTAMGAGMDGDVWSLLSLGNNVVAGGTFVTAGGVTVNRVAGWDGTAWFPLGTGVDGTSTPPFLIVAVSSLVLSPTGRIVATGYFQTAGGVAVQNVAQWDGSAWSPFAPPGLSPYARALTFASNGDLIVIGSPAGSAWPWPPLHRWDGAAWTAIPAGPNDTLKCLTILPNGDLAVGGLFDWVGSRALGIATWDGANWGAPGSGSLATDAPVYSFTSLPNGDLLAAGSFTTIGGVSAPQFARWDGSTWAPFGATWPVGVGLVTTMPNGDIVMAGWFPTAGGVTFNHVARWDGVTWSPMGAGFTPGGVSCLTTMPNGDVIVGGGFQASGSTPTTRIARWNGVSWSNLGSGIGAGASSGDSVSCLTPAPNGDLYVGGHFALAGAYPASNIARRSGTSWLPLGTGVNGDVHAMALLPNGDLVAGGDFTMAGGVAAARIARWDGASWWPLGSGLDQRVSELAVLPNGDVIAVGDFTTAGGVGARRIARWNGATWAPKGTGIDPHSYGYAVFQRNGELWISGTFVVVGGTVSSYLARYVSTCPATAVATGVGCASSGGNNLLVPTALPWVDATFRATGTGLPGLGIVIAATGLGQFVPGAMPLGSLHPQGAPGCDLLVTPDIQQPLVVTNGTAQSDLFLPSSPGLTGLTFYHQWIPIEVDAAGGFVSITATNALQLTAGDF